MKISIIIPTYQPKEYIFQCLKSLKDQTLSCDLFEIIIILNGEKNPYYQYINDYININDIKNINLIYTEQKGVSHARNLGLEISKGEYIAFIDDDDYIDKNYLETMINTINNSPSNTLVCANYKQFRELEKDNKSITTNYLIGDKTDNLFKYKSVFSSIGAKLIPKSIINNSRFDINLKNGEDSFFMVEISHNIKAIAIANDETFYNRMIRQESAHFKKKSLREIFSNTYTLLRKHHHLLLKNNHNRIFILIRELAVIKGMFYQLYYSYYNPKK